MVLDIREYDPAGRLFAQTDAANIRREFAYMGDSWPAGVRLKNFRKPDGTVRGDIRRPSFSSSSAATKPATGPVVNAGYSGTGRK